LPEIVVPRLTTIEPGNPTGVKLLEEMIIFVAVEKGLMVLLVHALKERVTWVTWVWLVSVIV
jgi:hypothetical protein